MMFLTSSALALGIEAFVGAPRRERLPKARPLPRHKAWQV